MQETVHEGLGFRVRGLGFTVQRFPSVGIFVAVPIKFVDVYWDPYWPPPLLAEPFYAMSSPKP